MAFAKCYQMNSFPHPSTKGWRHQWLMGFGGKAMNWPKSQFFKRFVAASQ
jgi:hypothetical protein